MVSHKGASNKRDLVKKTKGDTNEKLGSKSYKNGPIKKPYFGKNSKVKLQHLMRKKLNKRKRDGIVYLGNLPHGFFEEELKGFFSQFGYVRRVKVARSIKNARPRGYAFIEFADGEVAKIVANTMNGYLMYNKILKCHVIPVEKGSNYIFSHTNLTPEKCPRVKSQRQHQLQTQKIPDAHKFIEKKREVLRKKATYLKHNVGVPLTPQEVLQRKELGALIKTACEKRHQAKQSVKELNRATNGTDPAPSKRKATRRKRKSTSLDSATPSAPVKDNDVSSSASDLTELNKATNGSGLASSKRKARRLKRKSTPSAPIKDNDDSSADSKSPKRKSSRISNQPGTNRANTGRKTKKPGRENAKNKPGKNVNKKLQTFLKKRSQKDFGGKGVISTQKDKVKPQGGKKKSIKKVELKKSRKFNKGLQN